MDAFCSATVNQAAEPLALPGFDPEANGAFGDGLGDEFPGLDAAHDDAVGASFNGELPSHEANADRHSHAEPAAEGVEWLSWSGEVGEAVAITSQDF